MTDCINAKHALSILEKLIPNDPFNRDPVMRIPL